MNRIGFHDRTKCCCSLRFATQNKNTSLLDLFEEFYEYFYKNRCEFKCSTSLGDVRDPDTHFLFARVVCSKLRTARSVPLCVHALMVMVVVDERNGCARQNSRPTRQSAHHRSRAAAATQHMQQVPAAAHQHTNRNLECHCAHSTLHVRRCVCACVLAFVHACQTEFDTFLRTRKQQTHISHTQKCVNTGCALGWVGKLLKVSQTLGTAELAVRRRRVRVFCFGLELPPPATGRFSFSNTECINRCEQKIVLVFVMRVKLSGSWKTNTIN